MNRWRSFEKLRMEKYRRRQYTSSTLPLKTRIYDTIAEQPNRREGQILVMPPSKQLKLYSTAHRLQNEATKDSTRPLEEQPSPFQLHGKFHNSNQPTSTFELSRVFNFSYQIETEVDLFNLFSCPGEDSRSGTSSAKHNGEHDVVASPSSSCELERADGEPFDLFV
jgi:hypothetical protein